MERAGKRIIVVHYDEIGIKGKNRSHFEHILMRNIQKRIPEGRLERQWGRILVHLKSGIANEEIELVRKKLKRVPGIASFGYGRQIPFTEDLSLWKSEILELLKHYRWNSFVVRVKRINKDFPLSSQELERSIGGEIFVHFREEKRVKLKNPDVFISIEILDENILMSIRERGIGGLPVGSSGKAFLFLSGGFDSPVAGYELINRGVRPLALHFHGMPQTSPIAIEKVRKISAELATYAGPISLFLVPVLEVMKTIKEHAPDKLRLILLRRFMMHYANALAKREGGLAVITGDSVGQVASQTLENMHAIGHASELPVLRPLSGRNKNEIIEKSRMIGTHDISVLPHDDTCSLFVPQRPETKAKLHEVIEAERGYDLSKLVDDAMRGTTRETIDPSF